MRSLCFEQNRNAIIQNDDEVRVGIDETIDAEAFAFFLVPMPTSYTVKGNNLVYNISFEIVETFFLLVHFLSYYRKSVHHFNLKK